MEESKLKEVELLIKLIEVGQAGSVRPDNGRSSDASSVCNSTGVVRDANYCKNHLQDIWSLLGSEKYFGFSNAVTKI